jgi:hypothetical protein
MAQIIGEFWKNRWSGMNDVAPIVLALYSSPTVDIIGTVWHPALIGKSRNARCAYRQSGVNSQGQLEVFAVFFFIPCASFISRVWIAGPIVLVQHKGNERIGEAPTSIRRASPIVIEISFNSAVLTGNGNMFNTRQRWIKSSKECPAPQPKTNTQWLALF